MYSIEINSLLINALAILPIAIVGIIVEKHFTKFWVAFWNLFAIISVGVSMLIAPVGGQTFEINFGSFTLPLYSILFLYAFPVLIMGWKIDSDIIRNAGSSILTASILVSVAVFQYLKLSDPILLLGTGVVTIISLLVLRKVTKNKMVHIR